MTDTGEEVYSVIVFSDFYLVAVQLCLHEVASLPH